MESQPILQMGDWPLQRVQPLKRASPPTSQEGRGPGVRGPDRGSGTAAVASGPAPFEPAARSCFPLLSRPHLCL